MFKVNVLKIKDDVNWGCSGVFTVKLSRFFTLPSYFHGWLWKSKYQFGAMHSHDLHFAKYAIQLAATSAKQHVFYQLQVFFLCIYKDDTKHNWASNAASSVLLMKSPEFLSIHKVDTKHNWTSKTASTVLFLNSSWFFASTKLIQSTTKPVISQTLSIWRTVLNFLLPQGWCKTQMNL